MSMKLWLPVALGCTLATSTLALAEQLVFTGMCDASAAVALDDTHFAVADDERDTLRIYDLTTLEQTSELNLTAYLHNRNKKGEPKEADLEGAVRRGQNVIWISSHGRNKDAQEKVFRWRLFATPIIDKSPPALAAPTHEAYPGFHADLMAYGTAHPELGLAQAEPNPPKKGGLNIEGLADAGDDDLYIGLRSPLWNGQAIVLKMLDVSGVLSGGLGPIKMGEPLPLDLGGRGIRSMERVGDHYLIIAGPSTEDDSSEGTKLGFKLYTWNGTQSRTISSSDTDFTGLSPEALFEIGATGHFMALSDDGTVKTGGVKCKDNDAAKSFRAITFDPL
ncbi:DUF3616 domain-containing protein [Mesorhizobium sp. M0046]|uniref:DUF3616 domain-containing protein n=1 Tax=Mesorhizobium sp. M0046 TaxID=2956858 RepID=UPI003339B238